MLMLYFSGTGNSKYIAELFAKNMDVACHSVEEAADFDALISAEDTIGFCYPIYGSRVPRIMREFVLTHIAALRGKKLVIFCTQMTFSGDGARCFTDLFPKGWVKVIYAEHFLMPNNVCNFFLLPRTNAEKIAECLRRAGPKMDAVCQNIKTGVVKRRGFNPVSRALGLVQGASMPEIERKARDDVRVNASCNGCGLCATLCPMHNLKLEGGKAIGARNCIMCYRCVNRCGQKAITTFSHEPVKEQYHGPTSE